MNYKLSRESKNDIKNIYLYTFQKFGIKQAVSYHMGLELAFENLCKNPKIGKKRIDIDTATRSLINQSHIIYYEIQDNIIFVLRVLHGQQDPSKHL